MAFVEVKDWSFLEFDCDHCSNGKQIQLAGICTGDFRFKDGSYIITSKIISSQGRTLVSQNGTYYLLKGEPSKYWLEDQEMLGKKIDVENPLKVFFQKSGVSE